MEQKLKGQTALVTGASSGIGQAIAIELAQQGAQVGINFPLSKEKAGATLKAIEDAGGQGLLLLADISRESEVLQMFDTLIKTFGHLDILVNNAGIQKDSSFEKMSLQDWQQVIDVNLTGHFLCSREAIKLFLKAGVREGISRAAGKIIFISSVHDIIPWSTHANYAAAKGGLKMLMRTLALEFAPHRIRVNSVSPGAIKTPINKAAWETPEAENKLLELIPYGRVGITQDIAKIVTWLASDEADYLNGETIYADGGMTLYPGFAHGG